jgi:hypothetical protein
MIKVGLVCLIAFITWAIYSKVQREKAKEEHKRSKDNA